VEAARAAARASLVAPAYALERALEKRRALDRAACLACVLLREFGPDAAVTLATCPELETLECDECGLHLCNACFAAQETCHRCDRKRCGFCCRESHGEVFDEASLGEL
jgi:hypothetical protein